MICISGIMPYVDSKRFCSRIQIPKSIHKSNIKYKNFVILSPKVQTQKVFGQMKVGFV